MPASTARSTGAHSGPLKCAVLIADDQPRILLRHVGRRLGLHVVEILLVLPAAHAVADDVEEGEDAGLGSIDDALLEVLEVAPAGASGVRNGCHTDAERVAVGIQAVVTGVGSPLPCSGVGVRVNVDQARRHVQPGHVDRLQRVGRIELRVDGGDLSVGDRDVSDGADLVPRVDDMPAAKQQIVLRAAGWSLRRLAGGRCQEKRCGHRKCDDADRACHHPLRPAAVRRVAVQVAPRYSPMSSAPLI